MDVVFADVEYGKKVRLAKKFLDMLPKKVALFTTVQFISQIDSVAEQIRKSGREVLLLKAKRTRHNGQLLGCNIEHFAGDFDAFCFVGDGLFHPQALLVKNEKDVFVFNPFNSKGFVLTKKDAALFEKKIRAALAAFKSAKNIGVLVTAKPGQQRLKDALALKNRFPDKVFTVILADTLDIGSLEDFNFVEVFVNTACPRIAYDDAEKFRKPVINIDEI